MKISNVYTAINNSMTGIQNKRFSNHIHSIIILYPLLPSTLYYPLSLLSYFFLVLVTHYDVILHLIYMHLGQMTHM